MSASRISCSQGFSIAIVAEPKKGHSFAILGPTEKICVRLFFFTDATYRFYTNWFQR